MLGRIIEALVFDESYISEVASYGFLLDLCTCLFSVMCYC